MYHIQSIISFIDNYLEENKLEFLTAKEANRILEKSSLLNDSKSRKGGRIRKLLREEKYPYAYKKNGGWRIISSKQEDISDFVKKVANEIIEVAEKRNYQFFHLQKIRNELKNKTPKPFSIFSNKTFGKDYVFNSGGRKEIQFNIGRDYKGNVEITRYGLAFSLQSSNGVRDLLEILFKKIERFNKFYSQNKNYFKNISMWYYDLNGKHDIQIPQKIPSKIIKKGNFIFIGRYFEKSIIKIDTKDINEILVFFDYLLELYTYVEAEVEKETRIARICWNTNGWIKPSGRLGKSKSKSHEKEFGYGHEEWLFDTGKLYKGFIYGFLQPINKYLSTYIGQKFNLILYTINGDTKEKYWIGHLNNVEVIGIDESKKVLDYYISKNWLQEYKEDLIELSLWNEKISKFWKRPDTHFNIKLHPDEIKIYNERIPFINKNLFKKPRYTLNYLPKDFSINELEETGFDPDSGSSDISDSKKKKSKRIVNAEIEIPSKHHDILNGLMKFLKKKYKNQTIKKESKAFGNSKIDLFRKTEEGYIFYEVKSYNNLMISLRIAIGQLLEYNCYPTCKNAFKMYLVSDRTPDNNFINYIHHLNSIIDIPFGYIQFDFTNNEIINEL